jgi:hypothetical protein
MQRLDEKRIIRCGRTIAAAVAPPSSVMNSQRLMGFPKAEDHDQV